MPWRAANERSSAFSARLDNARTLAGLLKGIQFREKAVCILGAGGIKFIVEDARSIQASIHLQASLFQDYHVPERGFAFGVDLSTLVECLGIFSGPSSAPPGCSGPPSGAVALKMSYEGPGHAFMLMMEEGGVVTHCRVHTLELDEPTDFEFHQVPTVSKVIIKSEFLKDAFAELGPTGDRITVAVSASASPLRLSSETVAGSTEVDFQRDPSVVESFHCDRAQTFSYKLSLLWPSIRALAQSTKTLLRINERGFLSLQYMIPLDDQQITFIEYISAPLVTSDEGQLSMP